MPRLLVVWCIFAAATDPDDEGPQFHSRWFDWEGITESIAYASAVQDLPSRRIEFPATSSDSDAWIMSGNVADYRMFKPVLSVSLPVPVNLIFIGFDGDGAQSLELEKHDFKEWFEHIEHSFRHTIVPVGEEQTTTERYETPPTNIKYRFHFNLIKLHPMVNTVLEDVILWHIRPEDPRYNPSSATQNMEQPTRFYVDAFKVSRVLEHLLVSLNLTQAYTLFILNPKSPVEEGEIYGYRAGFSQLEIDALRERQNEWSLGNPQGDKGLEVLPSVPDELAPSKDADDLKLLPNEAGDNQKLRWSNLVDNSEIWARWFVKTRGAEFVPLCNAEDLEDDPRCIANSQRAERKDIVELIRETAFVGGSSQQRYLQRIRDGLEHENCLVDTWAGHSRFGLIDLSAGPFKWGPIIAGQGVRSNTTLPSVPKFAALEADRELSQGQRVARKEELRKSAAINAKVKDALEARKAQEPDEDTNAAEIELVKGYYAQHCGTASRGYSDKHNFVNCNLLAERIKDLEKKLKSADKSNLFTGSEEEGEGESMVLDNFLSKLGAVISSTLRHIVTPPAPLFPAYHTPRVTFHFFLISNEDKPLQYFDYEAYKKELLKFKLPSQEFSFVIQEVDMKEDQALTEAFRLSLRSAMLPSLSTAGDFSTNQVHYIESKALQQQLRTMALHDKADDILAREAETAKGTQSDKKKKDHSHKNIYSGKGSFSRHIPIFFFSMLGDPSETPIFIDKYYQAKALSDMVLIVQSSPTDWESRLACNNNPIYWDLRNPLKPALAATMLHYGGLVPTHITYDEANKAAAQQWLWSVGDNPLSYTSRGHHFSEMHHDIVLRNFIVNALEDSIVQANEAIRILLAQATTLENFKAPIPGMEMTVAYGNLRKNWERIAELVKKFDFADALAAAKAVESYSKQFKKLAVQTADTLTEMKCLGRGGTSETYEFLGTFFAGNAGFVILGIVVNLLLIGLYLAFRRRRMKVKTN